MFGYVVLFGWPLVVLTLFKTANKPVAIIGSLIAGYLLLPEQLEYDLPLLPNLNKNTIPALAIFAVLLTQNHKKDKTVLLGWLPKNKFAILCILVLILGTFFMIGSNGDTIRVGPIALQALTYYDAISLLLSLLVILLPLLFGRKFLAHPEQHLTLLLALTIAGALYAFLALYEIRMSPQLNNIVYGFFSHSFFQHIRGDGFRPLVFLNHGLWLAIFFAMCTLSAFAMARVSSTLEQRVKFLILGMFILLTLALSRSLGALVIALLLLPVVFIGRRIHLLIATGVAVIVMLYPVLRGAGFIPLELILSWAEAINPERAASLLFRVNNEEILLEKAMQRPIFGWGGWGRSFIYNEAGERISITDGYWIIIIGIGGWVRYIAEFGLLCLPIFLLFYKRKDFDFGVETTLLTLVLAANLLDLIPNATITPLTWLIAGALWGRFELEYTTEEKKLERYIKYSRFDAVMNRKSVSLNQREQR